MKFKLTLGHLIVTLIIVSFVLLCLTLVVHEIAQGICDESEVVPFRYESQGLFGTMVKIETTENNADGHARLCINWHETRFFALSDNLNYILEKAQEQSEKQGGSD